MAQRGDARYRRLKYPPTAAVAISSEYFVVGGGGGKAKTGVPNRITLVADSKPDLLEVAHVDFGDDRVVGLALHPKEKMCVVTTSGGAAHGCVYTDKELKKVFSATTAQAAADGEYPNQRAVAISPKGNEVAMGLGHKIALWKLGKNEKGLCDQKVLEAVHTDAVKEIIFTDDATSMVSIDDGACVVWELPSGKQVRKGVAGAGGKCPGKLRGLALGAEGSKRLYTCVNSKDGGFVQERDMADKNLKILRSKQVTSNMISAMSCRPAGQWLSVGDSEGNVILWNIDTMSRAIEAEVHVMAVSKICMLAEGDTFSVSLDNYCAKTLVQAKMARRGRVILMLILAFVFCFIATFVWFQFSVPDKTEL